jgi:uncharacterized alpha-E superfamily protein
VIARVADHCFWLGRYVERAESTARVLQVTGSLSLDAELPSHRCWHPVVIVAGQEADFVARFGRAALGDAQLVQRYLVRDDENPVSLRRSVAAARENARAVREVVSLEVWQVVNELHVFLASDEAEAMYEHDLDALYARVQRGTQLALGLMRSTMLHDAPLDYIWLGVLLERVSQTARLLDVEHHALSAQGAPHPVLETALWLSLLRACSGFEAFMKRNRGKVSGVAVAAFLVLEPRFPRSVRYCTGSARERLAAICDGGDLPGQGALARLAALEGWLQGISPESLHGARVHEVLTHVVDEVHAACDGIMSELLGGGALDPAQDPPRDQTRESQRPGGAPVRAPSQSQ